MGKVDYHLQPVPVEPVLSQAKALHDLLLKKGTKVITIVGAKSAQLVYKDGFTGVKVTTEDGSAGLRGIVTGVLADVCSSGFGKNGEGTKGKEGYTRDRSS